MAKNTVQVLLILVTLLSRRSLCVDECRAVTYAEPGDVKFSLIVSLRGNKGQGTCGDVAYGALQYLLAVKYVLQKLNTMDTDGNTFVPGVKLGFEVYDDCGNEEYATAHALDAIEGHFPKEIVECTSDTNSSIFAGIIGPSRSQSTAAVSEVLRNTEIPLVTMASTLSELSNKTKYPNVLRTSAPDSMQSKAIVSLLKELKWTVVAIVHTTDNYGMELAESIQELAKGEQICVIHVEEVTTQTQVVQGVLRNLLTKQTLTAENSMGVIYTGQWDVAKQLVSSIQDLSPSQPELKKLKWIMSDGVGTNTDVMVDFENFALTISPTSTELPEFGLFVQSEIDKVESNSENATIPWLVDYVKKACKSVSFPGRGCETFEQNDYASATINAAYAMSAAVKSAHSRICKGVAGMCPEFRNRKMLDLLTDIRNVSLKYSSLDENHLIQGFTTDNKYVKFKENGDMIQDDGKDLYNINLYQDGRRTFRKVGSANKNGSRLDPSITQQTSSCGRVCEECIETTPFVYLPGEILLAGFVSMHWGPAVDNPFGCGEFRAEVHTVIAVEAFLYMVKKMKADTGLDFGAVIFDDCYSNLKADLIISKYFSGEILLKDPRSGRIIDFSKVVAIIGSESSSVSLPLAESFTRMRLPVISPASTTPDLDDRGLYPYFMRTVPSDKGTGDVMVAIVKHFQWTYINIVYVNNNYGYKAMLKVQEKAREEGICVAEPISLEVTNEEKEMIDIIKRLSENGARVVIFIGIEDGTKAFQYVLARNKPDFVFLAAEDWAVSLKHVPGTEDATEGSLVFMSDPPQNPRNEFPQYMQKRTPNLNEKSLWFDRFWQRHFKCNLPGRFEKKNEKVCDPGQRFDNATTKSWLKHFRVGNTINAVAAVISGVIKARNFLCTNENEFACRTYKEHPIEVAKFIREITLDDGSTKFRPFRDDGNGNIGTGIYNLQRQPGGTHAYVKVGSYDFVNKLMMIPGRSVFYSKGEPVNNVKATCTVTEICNTCKTATASGLVDVPDCSPRISRELLAILILVSIICFLVAIVLAIVACLLCRRGQDKERPFLHVNGTSPAQPPSTSSSNHNGGPSFENQQQTYNSSQASSGNLMGTLAEENNSYRAVPRPPAQMPGTPITNTMNGRDLPTFENQPASYSSSALYQANYAGNTNMSPMNNLNLTRKGEPLPHNQHPSYNSPKLSQEKSTEFNPGDYETPYEEDIPERKTEADAPPLPSRFWEKSSDRLFANNSEFTGSSLEKSGDEDQTYLKAASVPRFNASDQTNAKVIDDHRNAFSNASSASHQTSLKTNVDSQETAVKAPGSLHSTHNIAVPEDLETTTPIMTDPRYSKFPRNEDGQDGYLSAIQFQTASEQGEDQTIANSNLPDVPSLSQQQSMALPLHRLLADAPESSVDFNEYGDDEV